LSHTRSAFWLLRLSPVPICRLFTGFGGVRRIIQHAVVLDHPLMPGTFAESPYPFLNGSMWTIAYEFTCYLAVLVLGTVGFFRKPWVCAVVVAGLLIAIMFDVQFGYTKPTICFTTMFFSGSAFYLLRARIPLEGRYALAAAIALISLLFVPQLATPAVAVFGGYLIFWFAFLPDTPLLNRLNSRTDLSYGTYLYAWPIQKLLIWFIPGIGPMMVLVLATLGSVLMACLSWRYVEQPCLALKRRVGQLRSSGIGEPHYVLLRVRRR
jgi:peptidoglycan/LPS O-acetylase OafA/YrhL